ncbi:MAG: hypothetical protein AAF152_16680 [Cyanobacteria bacterium P01_A01_bin.114]
MGVVIIVVPRLLITPRAIPTQPIVARLGLTALRLNLIQRTLSLRYTTLAEYNQLQLGLPLSTVESWFGKGAQIRSQPMPDGTVIQTYEWQNPDGGRLIVTFQDMKLIGKAQAGLR